MMGDPSFFKRLDIWRIWLCLTQDGRARHVFRNLIRLEEVESASLPPFFNAIDARNMLSGLRVAIVGDSIGRHIYRDFISLLQGGNLPTVHDYVKKGEKTYRNDILVEGGMDGKRCCQ